MIIITNYQTFCHSGVAVKTIKGPLTLQDTHNKSHPSRLDKDIVTNGEASCGTSISTVRPGKRCVINTLSPPGAAKTEIPYGSVWGRERVGLSCAVSPIAPLGFRFSTSSLKCQLLRVVLLYHSIEYPEFTDTGIKGDPATQPDIRSRRILS